MKRFLIAILLFIVAVLPMRADAQALASANPAQPTFSDFVMNNFINHYKTGGIHEKLYMVTDKPYYSAGDTIYFSAFLVN